MYNCKLGKVVKLRGYKGEIVVDTRFNNVEMFRPMTSILVDNREYKIEYFKNLKNRIGLKLVGIDGEIDAKKFIGKIVYYDKAQVNSKEIVLEEAIDFTILDEEGKVYGYLDSIENYGAGNLLVVIDNDNEFYLPENKGFITKIDYENKQILVDKKLIKEVL